MVFGGPGVGYYSKIGILPSVANYTGFAPKPVQKLSLNNENYRKSSKIMIFHDFWKFTKSNDPTNTGRTTRGVFPARKRAFPRRFEMFEQYFQHFPGFGGRYRVVETTRSHQNDENVEN